MAGRPKLSSPGKEPYDLSSKHSLYQKITYENMEANRNAALTTLDKRNITRSYKNAQKTFAKA